MVGKEDTGFGGFNDGLWLPDGVNGKCPTDEPLSTEEGDFGHKGLGLNLRSKDPDPRSPDSGFLPIEHEEELVTMGRNPLGVPDRVTTKVLGMEHDGGREVVGVDGLEEVFREVEDEVVVWNQLFALRGEDAGDGTEVTVFEVLLFQQGTLRHHF